MRGRFSVAHRAKNVAPFKKPFNIDRSLYYMNDVATPWRQTRKDIHTYFSCTRSRTYTEMIILRSTYTRCEVPRRDATYGLRTSTLQCDYCIVHRRDAIGKQRLEGKRGRLHSETLFYADIICVLKVLTWTSHWFPPIIFRFHFSYLLNSYFKIFSNE